MMCLIQLLHLGKKPQCSGQKNRWRLLMLMMPLLLPMLLLAQTKTVTGTVKDEKGNPLPGVSVLLRGTTTGTKTDASGKFTIFVGVGTVLSISYTGYETSQVTVKDKSDYSVALKERAGELTDVTVVNIGYGAVKRKDLTGAIGTVDVKDLQKAPIRSFDEALAGRVAGVQVSSVDGQPGSAINIIIRGANSISQSNSPLYVVDGFPREGDDVNNNRIDPNDIETIDVLKDAAATAIYGARGANGVVIITTKKGKAGKPVIAFNSWVGTQKMIKKMDMLGAADYFKLGIDDLLAAPPPSDYNAYALSLPTAVGTPSPFYTLKWYTDSTRPVDWQSLMFKPASMMNHSLSISGGNDATQYSMSGNYMNQDGILINTGYKRYLGKVTLDQKINDKLKVGINATYSYVKQSGLSPNSAASGSATGSLLYRALGSVPFTYNSDSAYAKATSILTNSSTNASNYYFNPVIDQENLVRTNASGDLFANVYAEYAITPHLKFRSTAGIDYTTSQNIAFNDTLTLYGSALTAVGSNGANGSIANGTTTQWSNENTFNYTQTFAGVHNVNLLAGFSEQGYNTSTYTLSNAALAYPDLGIAGINQSRSTSLASINESSGLWTAVSFFGRAQYNYASKYYLSASLRRDGSSKFAPQNYWSMFPAFSAKWQFSNEEFFKDIKNIVSSGGIRGSYGKSGNNRIPNFAYLSQILTGFSNYGYTFNTGVSNQVGNQAPGSVASVLGNPDLKWETTKSYDLGLDLGFLHDRINFTADAYKKNTYNLLYNAPVPTSTGFKTAYKNIGDVQNEGIELSLSTVNVKSRNFTWTSSFNITFYKSKVLALTQGLDAVQYSVAWDNAYASIPAYLLKVGQPLGELYGLQWVGNYQYSDFNKNAAGQYILKDNVTTNQSSRNTSAAGTAPQPGDIKFKDINGDGVINANDEVPIGRGFPIHTGGFGNNFTYKNFDLNIFFQWSYGNQIQNVNRMKFEDNLSGINQFTSVLNRWTPTNQNNTMFRAGTGAPQGPTFYSSRTVEDGSYLRLKTVQIGYALPNSLLKKWKVKQIRFYLSGQNLITWTKYTGFDPEVSTFYSTVTPGFDWGAYPRARTFTFGANLSF